MDIAATATAIDAEANRLEQRLNDDVCQQDEAHHQVLLAAAWEVSELDYLFANGYAAHVLWPWQVTP